MNKTYILLDTANVFFRARHAIRGSLEDKIGMSIHTVLSSVRKSWREFKGDHVVFFLEGRSWRKDFYAPYKRQRTEGRAAASASVAASVAGAHPCRQGGGGSGCEGACAGGGATC